MSFDGKKEDFFKEIDLNTLIYLFKKHFNLFQNDFRVRDQSSSIHILEALIDNRNATAHNYLTARDAHHLCDNI